MIVESKELYIQNLPSGMPLYYQTWFIEAGSDNWTAFAYMENDEPVWIWAGVVSKKLGVKLFHSPVYNHVMCPVILKDSFDIDTLDEIFRLGRFAINDRYNKLQESEIDGWNTTQKFRQYIDMRSYPTELAGLKATKRNRIKKVQDCSINKKGTLEIFQKLHEQSYDRKGRKAVSFSTSELFYSKLISAPGKHYIYVLNDKEGTPLAVHWFYGYGDTIYDINRAKDYSLNQQGAQEYLIWHICQELRSEYDYFDLAGSSIKGVKRFNMDMGATDMTYYNFSKTKILI